MNATAPKCSCSCNEAAGPPALVYPCSGAADTGELADRAARRLNAEDKAWMSCLAGIGGRVSGLMANAAAAPALLAIDGCPQDCAKKTLELAGFTHVKHVRVTDLGFKKGKTPVDEYAIQIVAAAAAALIRN
ncbi:MAG: putative zinc-binding protein [Lacunisphaera sp.]|nr:putative zinc-binding protein [Lacunisphaera sp.]